jgi:hypothetical protein
METVTFQCGHCGNLMGVDVEFLGQQVRCPSCQQVVLAPLPDDSAPAEEPSPSSPAEAPSEPRFTAISAAEREDIFLSPTESEDLFDAPPGPRLEIPPSPSSSPEPPPEPPPEPAVASPPFPDAGVEPVVESTAPYTQPAEPSIVTGPPLEPGGEEQRPPSEEFLVSPTTVDFSEPAPAPADLGPAAPQSADWMDAGTAPEGGQEMLALAPVSPARRAERRSRLFIPLVLLPLISYAVLATICAVIFLVWLMEAREDLRRRPTPFDKIPDLGGDEPGVKRLRNQFLDYPSAWARDPLPDELVTRLGQTLRIGALEVTPLRVERKRVAVVDGTPNEPRTCDHDSLVLHLRVKNVSQDQAFVPLDGYFDRKWSESQGGLPPLTNLHAGPFRFYGGPAEWAPHGSGGWIEGRKVTARDRLDPGAEKETFVCTDGNERMALLLDGVDARGKKVRPPYSGPMLWRIQVRRGLVTIRNKEFSACAVIGVAFTAEDIGKS